MLNETMKNEEPMSPEEFHTDRMLPKGETWTDRDAFLFTEAYTKYLSGQTQIPAMRSLHLKVQRELSRAQRNHQRSTDLLDRAYWAGAHDYTNTINLLFKEAFNHHPPKQS